MTTGQEVEGYNIGLTNVGRIAVSFISVDDGVLRLRLPEMPALIVASAIDPLFGASPSLAI